MTKFFQVDANDEIFERMLVESLRKGSIKAFDTIYRTYARRLFDYVGPAARSHEDAEEIVHDIFMNLWNVKAKLDRDTNISTLLFSIAYKRRIDAFRRILRAPIMEDYIELQTDIAEEDGSRMEYDDFLRIFNVALSRLPESRRRLVVMSRLKDMSNREIAKKIGLSEKTVRNGLSLGLKQLRNELSKLLGREI